MTIVLSNENMQPIKDVINETLRDYQVKHPKEKNEAVQNDDFWNIPEKIDFNANNIEGKQKKAVMIPYYSSTLKSRTWETEKNFIKFLDNHKQIDWWFKNGERDMTYFGIPYKDESGEDQIFYVDFIVKLADNKIGLFDTKSGWTAKDAGNKSDGLQKYIKELNKKGKNLFGGIVIPKSGSFYISTKIPYMYDKELADWQILKL